MTYSSFLFNNLTPLVLDASVLININASQCGARIVNALPNEVLIPETVVKELKRETNTTENVHGFTQELVHTGKVRLVPLIDQEYAVYTNLISGPHSLGDGEAATIAICVCRGYLPIIDERKGRLRAREFLSDSRLGWSLDLFLHPQVIETLHTTGMTEALFFALRDGRMRIHETHCDQVVNLIGIKRALECTCLPGYKKRKAQWSCQLMGI